jgi:hypothetical protein
MPLDVTCAYREYGCFLPLSGPEGLFQYRPICACGADLLHLIVVFALKCFCSLRTEVLLGEGRMSQETSLAIFVSCGTPYQQTQEKFIDAVEAHLRSHGCTPITVGRSKYSVRQPAEAARDCIAECRGAIVIAFERVRTLKAVEYPNSAKEKSLPPESHPTIWNQMESAMAYSKDIPILTFVQTGIKRQGMLSNRLEWGAIEADLSPDVLRTEEFRQVFNEWLLRVTTKAKLKDKELNIDDIKISTVLTQLNAKQAWAAIVIAFGIVSGVATTAFKLGQTFPSP